MHSRPMVIVMLCLLLAACTAPGGAVSAPPSGPPVAHDPKNARQTEKLDLGRVRIYPRVGHYDLFHDREKEILELVAKKLKDDRNISMAPEIFYVSSAMDADPDHAMRVALESGDGPEIVIWQNYAKADPVAAQWMPLKLDDAIDKYGPNLRGSNDPGGVATGLVPEDCWADCKVGNATVAIPAWTNNRAGLIANQAELDALGAEVPTTIEELEALMGKAKEQGVKFISDGIEHELSSWYGLSGLQRVNGKLRSGYTQPAYTDYLNRLLNWQKNGWFIYRGDNSANNYQPPAKPNDPWLFRSADNYPENSSPYSQRYFKNAVAVPPIDLSGRGDGLSSIHQVQWLFQSYNKPEALVSLLDWALSDGANENLLHWGVEGEDYVVNADGTRRVQSVEANAMDYHTWSTLAWGFGFTGLFGPDPEDGTPQEFTKALGQLEQYARDTARPSDISGLPQLAFLYTRPGSQLEAARHAMTAYAQSMGHAERDVLSGNITVQDFQQAAIDGEKGIQGYIALLEGVEAGTYDPVTDMYQPASQ